MKFLSKFYFSMFPLVLFPFMFLLYDGNIYLYNLFSVVVLFVIIVNTMLLKGDGMEDYLSSEAFKRSKRMHKVNIILFIASYITITIWFITAEVLPGFGSV